MFVRMMARILCILAKPEKVLTGEGKIILTDSGGRRKEMYYMNIVKMNIVTD